MLSSAATGTKWSKRGEALVGRDDVCEILEEAEEESAPPLVDLAAQYAARGQLNASKTGRNDPCSCGSLRKYKDCHGR